MTNLGKKIFIVTSILLVLLSTGAYSQRYSVDDERNMKSQKLKQPKLSKEERYVQKLEKKTEKEETKEKKKNKKLRKKYVKKYNKKVSGGGNEVVKQEKVYKRMKKSKKAANKNNKKR